MVVTAPDGPAGVDFNGAVTPSSPAPVLADDVELIGEYQGSGSRRASWLLRRDGRTIEVSPLLYLVCANLVPGRSFADVATAVGDASGRTATVADVAYLLEHKLAPLGVLAGSPVSDRARRRGRQPASALAVRRVVLSESAVATWSRPLQFLFRPAFLVATLVALGALDLRVLRGGRLPIAMHEVAGHPGLVVLVAALTVVAGAFHELGHATACRYGGAEPGVIGVGIYLIWPVFYNNLDGCYRLDRAGRLRADLGGVYFNAVFIVALGAAYLATGFRPLVVAIAVEHLVMLHQFLPFVRLDGYYMVSDLAGVPDLFGLIRPIVASWVPGRPPVAGVRDLRRAARAVVTVWVVLTVPAVAAVLVLFVARLPDLVTAGVSGTTGEARALVVAVRAGGVGGAAVHGMNLAILTVPAVGVVLTVARACRSTLVSAARG